MSEAGYKNVQTPSLEKKQGKRRITSLKLCNMKRDFTSRVDGCQHLRRDVLIFSVSFQKHCLRQSRVRKETTKIQRCSEPRDQQMSTAVDQTATIPRTRESSRDPGEQQHTVTRKTCVLVKNCHPRVTFGAPKPDTRNSVQQRRRKARST